jgi:type IV pilus assembly protein PilW
MNQRQLLSRARPRQAGFTLVEMMVAMSIGLVVLLGMTATFVNLKNTFRSQDQLGQLQDGERLAMSILTNSLNEAGYYPDPKNASPIVAQPAWPSAPVASTMAAGQSLSGTVATSSDPETFTTTYASVSGDGLMSCLGTTNLVAGNPVTVRNTFYVDTASNTLRCKVMINGDTAFTNAMANGGTAQELISGVQSMSVLYGVDSDGDGVANTYYDASGAAGKWSNVTAVRLTLFMVNPFDSSNPIKRVHTVNLMN